MHKKPVKTGKHFIYTLSIYTNYNLIDLIWFDIQLKVLIENLYILCFIKITLAMLFNYLQCNVVYFFDTPCKNFYLLHYWNFAKILYGKDVSQSSSVSLTFWLWFFFSFLYSIFNMTSPLNGILFNL